MYVKKSSKTRTLTNCCKSTKKHKKCIRTKDKKVFALPRKFSKKNVLQKEKLKLGDLLCGRRVHHINIANLDNL